MLFSFVFEVCCSGSCCVGVCVFVLVCVGVWVLVTVGVACSWFLFVCVVS